MRWTAERAIIIGFIVAVVILTTVGMVSYRNTILMEEATAFAQHSRETLQDLREFSSLLEDVEAAARGYAITSDPEFLKTYDSALPRIAAIAPRLSREIRNPAIREKLGELLPLATKNGDLARQLIALRGNRNPDPVLLRQLIDQGRDNIDRIRQLSGEMQAGQFERLQYRAAAAEKFQHRIAIIIVSTSAAAVLFLTIATVVILSDLRTRKKIEAALRGTTALQEAILNGAAASIIAMDVSGVITSFNRASESMLGYKAEEVVGKVSPIIILDPNEISARADALAVEFGRPVEVGFGTLVAKSRKGLADSNEWTYIRKDGTRLPVLLSVTTLRDVSGEVAGYLALASDITELKATQERLRHAEHRFRALIQGSSDIVVMLAPSSEILYLSPAVERILGYLPDEVIGKDVFAFVHPEDVGSARVAFGNTLAVSGFAVPLQIRLRGADGEYRWVEILANNLLNDPDLRAVVINARDIRERRELESRSALQSVVASVLADAETLPEASARLLEAIGGQMGYDLGELWRVDMELGALVLVEYWHAPGIAESAARNFSSGFSLGYGEGLPGSAWEASDVVLIPNLQTFESPRSQKSVQIGLHSAFGIPIKFGDEVIAVMGFASREKPVPDEETVHIFRALGNQIGNFMARKRAEQVSEGLRRQTHLILESAGEGIIGVDVHKQVTFVNAAAERILAYRAGELTGREIVSTLQLASSAEEETPIQTALEKGVVRNAASAQFFRKDGSSFPAQYIAAPILGDHGVVGAVITFQDITERREIERMKNEFVSVVSHELRTPLTSIRGALGLLASGKMGGFPDKAQRMLDIAVNNTDRLVRLINDILDIERIDSGRTEMQRQMIDIADIISQATDVMRPMADKAGVQIDSGSVNARVNVDPDRIIQTLTNLLSNAIKFSSAGGRIWIKGHLQADGLHLLVQDEGRGIPQDKLDSIFERFQQVDASDSREKGGTGLGLAICRTIVQQHGGRIWVESILGQGSTFHIVLPVAESATSNG